jgi:hypothetical protein
MNSGDNFTSVVAVLVVIGLPMAYAMMRRHYDHQERMAMLARGLVPPPDPRWARRAARHGWAVPGSGGAEPGFLQEAAQYRAQSLLRGGITVACVGMALLIGLSFIDPGRPGPWLLGGLIPLFVGIAQILSAIISGAVIGPAAVYRNAGSPPSGAAAEPPPAAAAGAPAQPPYGWRPGLTPELEKPPGPPDRF